jgi:homoserine dehydrogenase
VAVGKAGPEGLELRVHPAMLPHSHPLASVNDVFNAVFVRGNAVGEVMFYGRGAGSLPTGSSVAADILEVARGIVYGGSGRIACTCFHAKPIVPIERVRSSYYIRTETDDRPGVIAAIGTIFGNHGVSLGSVLQKQGDGEAAEIVWITHETLEGNLRAALAEIEALAVVRRIANWIRVEE